MVSSEDRWQLEFAAGSGIAGSTGGAVTVLLCGTEEFCREARRELKRKIPALSVVIAHELDTARRLAERGAPAAILAEDRVLAGDAPPLRQRRQAIAAALSLLAGQAPLVWIGSEEEAAAVGQLIPAGTAELVPRSALCLSAAVSLVQRHLRLAAASPHRRAPEAETRLPSLSLGELQLEGRDFGEVLRHELNNPLTGILGNAELLLLEIRRGQMQLPAHDRQRLEIIAELAVRMRETVRQLSDRWLAAGGQVPAEKQPATEEPPWPLRR